MRRVPQTRFLKCRGPESLATNEGNRDGTDLARSLLTVHVSRRLHDESAELRTRLTGGDGPR